MRVRQLEALHADVGSRDLDFLKISTDAGLVGWSEYNEHFGGRGLTAVIEQLSPFVVGADPMANEAIVMRLQAARRQAQGGLVQQAIGAIENALLDLKADRNAP